MAFTAKFGADGKGPADDVASSEWSDDTSKALREAGFKSWRDCVLIILNQFLNLATARRQ